MAETAARPQPARYQCPGIVPRAAGANRRLDQGPYRSWWGRFFKQVDNVLRVVQPFFPRASQRRSIERAVAFVTERLNGAGDVTDWVAFYPAIANSVMMFDTLGYPPDHPDATIAWRAVRKLLGGDG